MRIFPDGPSCPDTSGLVTALAMETSEEWQGRCYLDMTADVPAAEPARSAA